MHRNSKRKNMRQKRGIHTRLNAWGKSLISRLAETEDEGRIITTAIEEYEENPWPTVWWMIARRIIG